MPVFLYLRWAPWPFMVSALSVCLWMARNVSAWRKSPIHYWKITLTMRYIIDELPWASLAFNVLQYRLVKSSESQQNCLISSIHPVNYAIFILEFSRQKRDFFFVVKLRLLGYFPSLWLISTFQRFFLLFFPKLEILRRAGAMPISSRRCGMITKREAERLCKSFLGDNAPPKLPENFAFEVIIQDNVMNTLCSIFVTIVTNDTLVTKVTFMTKRTRVTTNLCK